MFKNYLISALRNIQRNKTYSLINIVGLAIGIASCLAVLLWVIDEISYDRFHDNTDHIYRCYRKVNRSGTIQSDAMTSAPIGPTLKSRIPGFSEYVRTSDEYLKLRYEGESAVEFGKYVDPAFLRVFSFQLLEGDPKTALSAPNSIVLSQRAAIRIFGDQDPMGRALENGLVVTGITADIPRNSSIEFDFLIPIAYADQAGLVEPDEWWRFDFETYFVLQDRVDVKDVGAGIKDIFMDLDPEPNIELYLQPLTDIRLHGLNGRGRVVYVYVFSIVAVLILIIACVNFMNLATARAGKRMIEIGLRKAVGASRRQLVLQILIESIIQTLAAMILALCLLESVLPLLDNLFGKELALEPTAGFIFILLGTALLLALVAGSYPAFVLSSFHPATVLKRITSAGGHQHMNRVRKILVVFQFTVSTSLIISALIIYAQLELIKNKDLGINRENIVCIRTAGLANDYDTLKNELLEYPGIVGVTAAYVPPAWCGWYTTGFFYEGKPEDEDIRTGVAWVDHDYADVFGLDIIDGRNFSRESPTDETEAYLVNEAAVKAMQMDSPIGRNLDIYERPGRIIGVVKNFHFSSLHNKVGPLVLAIDKSNYGYICAKLSPDDISGGIGFIEGKWNELRSDEDFQYRFFDEILGREYLMEMRTSRIVLSLTLITVLIACLGLFGLAAYSAELHTKEIGIRKVLGASVTGIVGLLSHEYLRLVLIANLLAWPIAYYSLSLWLENFAYRVDINWTTFAIAGVLALMIALITVSYQSVKAACANPVEVLKYE
jgi:putative ABC transport system permease protein